MEPQPKPQSSGGAGRVGGPPVVACGYSGDDEEKPRKNAYARREKRGPGTKELPSAIRRLRLYLKDVVKESGRLYWPSTGKFTETLLGVIVGLAILFVVARWVL